jgi:hypothetical protein
MAVDLIKSGSLLTTMAVELPIYSDDFAIHIRKKTDQVIESLSEIFEGLDLPEGIESTNQLSYIFLSMFEGAVTIAGLSKNEQIFQDVLEAFRTLLLRQDR